ncbi:hypothetical protein PRIPAC_82982 [Pristionchus pacificus]|uniref:Uncharacterized protein n=1 Tax=Pristionchus pacificus TaxID=54126 RepID=A0A2A6C2P9_PRIPA|nr:hypothetical protein PRIPAC_82982 [Pristionchus pacificus]|eukprot:PDM72378.1 hypothetical protein PRIPAC_38812 [Pristionchus pacificus]
MGASLLRARYVVAGPLRFEGEEERTKLQYGWHNDNEISARNGRLSITGPLRFEGDEERTKLQYVYLEWNTLPRCERVDQRRMSVDVVDSVLAAARKEGGWDDTNKRKESLLDDTEEAGNEFHRVMLVGVNLCYIIPLTLMLLAMEIDYTFIAARIIAAFRFVLVVPLIIGTTQGLLFSITIAGFNYMEHSSSLWLVQFPNSNSIASNERLDGDWLSARNNGLDTHSGYRNAAASCIIACSMVDRKASTNLLHLLNCLCHRYCCTKQVATTFVPTPQFSVIMTNITRKLYHMELTDYVLPYGATWTYSSTNVCSLNCSANSKMIRITVVSSSQLFST